MKIQRTIPPAAAPIYLRDFLNGIKDFIQGRKEIERFRSELEEYFGVRHCFLLSSGKAALTIILRALKDMHPERDEVLIPAFTCFSVPSAIVRAGLKVELCDIDPDTLYFDYDQLSAMSLQLNRKNKLLAVIPTHLFGIPADVKKVRNIVDDPDICIIEDAAQAMGGEWKGNKLGTMGDVGIFSLGRGKAFSTIEGGIIVTNQLEIAERIGRIVKSLGNYRFIELIRIILNTISLSFFLNPLLFWFPKSLPFLKLGETTFDPKFRIRKMSPFQAGLAKQWIKKLHRFKASRSATSKLWSRFTDTEPFRNYTSDASCRLSAKCYEPDLSHIRFPIRVGNNLLRKGILAKSQQSGLGIMPTYPDTINGIDELKEQFAGMRFPAGEKLVKELITVPTHPFVSKKDREKITVLLSDR